MTEELKQYLCANDYTPEQADKMLFLYRHEIEACIVNHLSAAACGDLIINLHMEDVDAGRNIL